MSYEDMNRHPFVLESFYREIASLTTNGDLSDPDVVLKPMIESFRRQEDQLLKSALERLPDRSNAEGWTIGLLDRRKKDPRFVVLRSGQ